jgi:hypothetical protein
VSPDVLFPDGERTRVRETKGRMDVRIRWKAITRSHGVEAYLAWRLRFEVGRLADRVTAVRAWFEDVKGPRGRADKRCAVELDGAFGRLYAAAYDADIYVAVDRAVKAIECSLTDGHERARNRDVRSPHPTRKGDEA